MVEDDLTLESNFKIDLARLPPCFSNSFPHIYKFKHCLAFYKQADEPFIEAPNPDDDKQAWLKNQNNLLGPIWKVESILPSALADIVASRSEVEDTTYEAKTKNRLIQTDPLETKGRSGRGRGQRPKRNFSKL